MASGPVLAHQPCGPSFSPCRLQPTLHPPTPRGKLAGNLPWPPASPKGLSPAHTLASGQSGLARPGLGTPRTDTHPICRAARPSMGHLT